MVRPELAVSHVEDPAEREADALAARVIGGAAPLHAAAMAQPTVGLSPGPRCRPAPHAPDGGLAPHRQVGAGEVGRVDTPALDLEATVAPVVGPELESYITGVTGGSALPDRVRQKIEPHLGCGPGDVRVHTGPTGVHAAAPTSRTRGVHVGHDIFLAGASRRATSG